MSHTIRKNGLRRLLGGLLFAGLGLSILCEAQATYTVTDLGKLAGNFHSNAVGINATGQVAGSSVAPSRYTHAFRTSPNAAINEATDDLGTLSGVISQAQGVNDVGQVVGMSFDAGGQVHAFRTAPNAAINAATDDLGSFGGGTSWAYGINAAGQVVGYSTTAAEETHAFRTAPSAAINAATDDLGGLFGPFIQASAYGINASAQVVGASYNGSNTHAFRTSPDAPINPATDDLGTLGGGASVAFGINAAGQVVGYAETTPGVFGYHAFRTAPNAAINPATDDLGTLGGAISIAYGINASGQVVGSAQVAGGDSHAFLYSDGVMKDLNSLISASDWVLREATGINDRGQIVGTGSHNGFTRAFRLDPPLSNLCLLYDWTKPYSAGSTIPIKLQLCDSNGNNLSSANITLHATGVTQVSTSISGPVQSSGNANPDNDFRFEPKLLGTGGYVFNLSTSGLPSGTYELNFTADLGNYAVPFQIK